MGLLVVVEVPRSRGVVLEDFQAVLDAFLCPHEAETKQPHQRFRSFPAQLVLQGLVSGERQEEVNEIRGDDMEEESSNRVNEITGFDAATGIPEAHAERVIVKMFPSDVQSVSPTDRVVLEPHKFLASQTALQTTFLPYSQ